VIRLVALLAVAAASGWAADAVYETCAPCHSTQVQEFKTHPHFAKQLDCNICHGNSVEHREAAGAVAPDKVVGPRGTPDLCGSCHTGPKKEFTASKHGALLAERGRARAPNCGTCHGVHALRTAPQMTQRCQNCHTSLPPSCDLSKVPANAGVACASCHATHLLTPKKP
jgi:hypothetical protein